MIEKNALNWLDMGEGLEMLDIYKNKKVLFIYQFFKTLLNQNNFPLYFYIILQGLFYFQLCCIIFPLNDDTDYSNDYIIYIIKYISPIILPQLEITNLKIYKIIMILITILLFILLCGFFIIFTKMNDDRQSYFFKIITIITNILLQIVFNYLIGPIVIICLISYNCKDGRNNRINSECLTIGKNLIFIILATINLVCYVSIAVFFSILYKEIGKIGAYTPKIQINTNFELYSGLSKIIIFILFFLLNTSLNDKKIYLIIYHLILLIIYIIFSYYISKNVYIYDKIMNHLIYLGLYITLWLCLVITLKDIFNLNHVSLFILLGWIIIIVATITLFKYNESNSILTTNIFEVNHLKDIEKFINVSLDLIQDKHGTNETILLGFFYKFREYLLANPDIKEKFNYLSNAVYLKRIYNDKSIINGYYIVYLIYDYCLSQNKSNNLLNIHFCYFLINHLKNTISAMYRCSKLRADSLFIFYFKYLLAENIKDYLVELNEANNKKNTPQNVQFSSLILFYLYQNLMRTKIADMAENQINYYDYFKNYSIGSKSSLGFLKVGKKIIEIRKEIKIIWDKILLLNPFCPEIFKEYMNYIKEILNDDIYYERELKNYIYINNSYLPQKNDFYYKIFDSLNSVILLSEYNDNKILNSKF